MSRSHGTSAYRHGCRCEVCRRATRDRTRRRHAREGRPTRVAVAAALEADPVERAYLETSVDYYWGSR